MIEKKSSPIGDRQIKTYNFYFVVINLLWLLIPSEAIANPLLQQAFSIPKPTNINDLIYLGKSVTSQKNCVAIALNKFGR